MGTTSLKIRYTVSVSFTKTFLKQEFNCSKRLRKSTKIKRCAQIRGKNNPIAL